MGLGSCKTLQNVGIIDQKELAGLQISGGRSPQKSFAKQFDLVILKCLCAVASNTSTLSQ